MRSGFGLRSASTTVGAESELVARVPALFVGGLSRRRSRPRHAPGSRASQSRARGSTSSRPSRPIHVTPRADHRRRSIRSGPQAEGRGYDRHGDEPGGAQPPSNCARRTSNGCARTCPAGWIEAVDDGDTAKLAALRAGLDLEAWCTVFGEVGYATPTWPAEYGAGLSLSPGQARSVNEVIDRVPGAAARGTSSASAWAARRCIAVGHRGAEAPVPARDRDQRGDLVPALQRARRRLRRRRAWRRAPSATATSGSSTVRRCGPRSRHVAKIRDARGAHRPRPAEAPGAQLLHRRHARARASTCGRSCRSPVTPSSTRCSSPTRASPTPWRLGPVGEGWAVALTTLMNERGRAVGRRFGRRRRDRRQPDRNGSSHATAPVADPRASPAAGGGVDRQPDHRLNNQRAADAVVAGDEAGPEGSITKLQQAMYNQRAAEAGRRPRGRARDRVGRRAASPAKRTLSFVTAMPTTRVTVGAWLPPRAGEHDRGRHVRNHAQHPRRAGARAPEGARRVARPAVEGRPSAG